MATFNNTDHVVLRRDEYRQLLVAFSELRLCNQQTVVLRRIEYRQLLAVLDALRVATQQSASAGEVAVQAEGVPPATLAGSTKRAPAFLSLPAGAAE
jgi:hypothetical protein